MDRRSAGSAGSAPLVNRPVAADWLALRREADHRAREHTGAHIAEVDSWLRSVVAPGQSVTVIDLGAGTGSNQAWLAPRLTVPQRWVLVDHDAHLLDVGTVAEADQIISTTRMVGSLDQLPQVVPAGTPTLITCSALLDLLSSQEAALLTETIAAAGAAAVLSLTVTGVVSLSPAHPGDGPIAAAFDAHQRRDQLLGPDAAGVVLNMLHERGASAESVDTEWVLDSSHAPLVSRYVNDRAQAAVEYDAALETDAQIWVQRRESQLREGVLDVQIGHRDIISVPRV